ncbi:MAG: GNAT family N-acetyltransferase [Clostridia bacterium]|nr:GNAT family N-acetyltransferase [Clostridia bacterium]
MPNHTSLIHTQPRGLKDWLRVYGLYRAAFPLSEQKPFSIIVGMYRRKKTDVWCLFRNGRFAGFATTINGDGAILLDYLAIKPALRGQGAGSAALQILSDIYPGRGLFTEIESEYEPCLDQESRKRRKGFYLKNGYVQLNVMARVFGVKMELLGQNCQMDFSDYREFYRTHYSPRAAENVLEEPHPATIKEDSTKKRSE